MSKLLMIFLLILNKSNLFSNHFADFEHVKNFNGHFAYFEYVEIFSSHFNDFEQ